MEQSFIAILKTMIEEQGKEALLNTSRCKALLADYTKNEYKKESRLLLLALEAGVQKAIDTTDNIEICKKLQVRILCDEYFLAEESAADVVDMLATVLRGDETKSKAKPTKAINQANPANINTIDINAVIENAVNEKLQKLGLTNTTQPKPNSGIQITPKIGSIIPFGDYDWRVLDVQNDKALLLSEKVIEKRTYHSSMVNITWEKCELRRYLNGEFYNKFNANEKGGIAETNVKTSNNPWYGTAGGSDTKDKIFLLSIEEVVKHFGDSGQLRSKSPNSKWWIDDQYNSARIAKDSSETVSWWWLRSPGNISTSAAHVLEGGYVHIKGDYAHFLSGGVRPVLWLNL